MSFMCRWQQIWKLKVAVILVNEVTKEWKLIHLSYILSNFYNKMFIIQDNPKYFYYNSISEWSDK